MFFSPAIKAVLFFGVIMSGLQVFYTLCLAGPPAVSALGGKGGEKMAFLREKMVFLAAVGARNIKLSAQWVSGATVLGLLSLQREFLQSHYQETACLRIAALPGDRKKKKKFRVTIEADDLVPSSAEAPKGNIVPKGFS